jgi:hypothetical protein
VSFVVGNEFLEGPTDTLAAHWSNPVDTLYNYQGQDLLLAYWHASEHLVVGDHEYLTAWDDWRVGIAIGEMNWYGPQDFIVGSASAANVAVQGQGADVGGIGLRVTEAMPARSRVGLEIDLPAAMRARLAMFDVAGRRVRTLLDRDLPAGSTAVMWDGRNASGAAVGSGLYFARLSWAGGERRAKVVLLK